MSAALDNLVATGQLKREPTSREEIAAFLEAADLSLADAQVAALSTTGRFKHAYDAAHALALAALRARGLRPDRGLGHRAIVFQSLAHTIDAEPRLWSTLDRYHTKRNRSEYGGLVKVSDAEARDLLALATELHGRVVRWLKTHAFAGGT